VTTELPWPGIAELAADIAGKRVSAVEVLESTLARVEQTEPVVHAFVSVLSESARQDARQADAETVAGISRGPLHGVPVAVKDLCDMAGHATGAGSRVPTGAVPETDATVVASLRRAGAVIIGKTVTHEFGYGLDSPPTVNAWQSDCYPGGSSAGSAVAVAVGSAFAAIGTDTAGSIRVPAAINGVVGLKPTYGRVGRRGVIPISPTLDTVGPLTRTVRDAGYLLQAIAGRQFVDGTALDEPVEDYSREPASDLRGMRIGVEREHFFYAGVQAEVRDGVERAIAELAALGAELVPISLAHQDAAVAAGAVVMMADAGDWHARLLAAHESQYAPATALALQVGGMVLAKAYIKAQKIRTLVQREVRRCFEANRIDAVVAPTVPITTMRADRLGSILPGTTASAFWSLNHHCLLANVVGIPSLSVPVGFSRNGLPIGMQLMGRPFTEAVLLNIGTAYQAVTAWHAMQPPWVVTNRPGDGA
jgi:aspartyl-tRNA(Asn)/glutamyl-tRNA(Gln) amidotransferase subunit A